MENVTETESKMETRMDMEIETRTPKPKIKTVSKKHLQKLINNFPHLHYGVET